jgi:CRISPR/Cas system CSM-associated protein Csm2 small subunit
MLLTKRFHIVCLVCFCCGLSFSQSVVNTNKKSVFIISDTTVLDSVSINPNTFKLFLNNEVVNDSLYKLDFVNATLIWKGDTPVNLQVNYTTFNFNLSFKTQHKDTSLIHPVYTYKNPFRVNDNRTKEVDLLGLSTLDKSGSISRGISVGNSQDLSVNSNFNLQLSGKIANDINILASITDNNIPIQPDGNTQQLQDFDRVFIQLFDKNWKLTAGDFITETQESYFMRYQKKAKGISMQNLFELKDSNTLFTRGSVAISRGKFATNTFQGIEGNQGPYKLTGAENEQLIIVLSGTEQIFIDGKLLDRGADKDYTIDYNTAEIIFTPQQLITKNKRIVVQFQYSDKNYIRSLAESEITFKKKKWQSTIHFYSEQDHKNQPLQQSLEDTEKQLLFDIGDDVTNAFIAREDTAGVDENAVLYAKVDTLGYKAFVFATENDSNLFRVRFSNVGAGNGNYIQDGFSVFGKVYKWVKPDTISGNIIKNGDFEPVILLVSPKKKQLLTFENSFQFNDNIKLNTDLAVSNTDINTFSTKGNNNNIGVGGRFELLTKKALTKTENATVFTTATNVEFISIDFNPIERYRPIEFTRDWNILNKAYLAPQLIGSFNAGLQKNELGKINYTFNVLDVSSFYRGYKNKVGAELNKNDFKIRYNGDLLLSESDITTNFYRHKSLFEKSFRYFKLGYSDEFENNKFTLSDSLLNNTYGFYDAKIYIANNDTLKNQFRIYVGAREEKNIQNSLFKKSAYSNDIGLDYNLISSNKKTKLKGNIGYRKLSIIDSTLGKAPENTFLNQTDFSTSFLKRLVTLNAFYEIGSGLEQKREFVYIEVNPGQGTYTWIDYNDNGIKELNEFEISVFADQANYIRIFTQSNQYIRTYSNKFSQSIMINPREILKKKEGDLLKVISKLSSLTAYKIDRKTSEESFESSLNPFIDNIADSSLVSVNKHFRSSVFLNRTGYKYGLSYSFQDARRKTLLSNGFDSYQNIFHEINGRYKIKKATLKWENTLGEKGLVSDFLANRNYEINYLNSKASLMYQKEINQSIDFSYQYQEKKNNIGQDYAIINTLGVEAMYNIINKVSLTARVNYVKIIYKGAENSSLEYEMLEGLKKGDNFTWEVLLNKRIAKNLSLTLNYNGRNSSGGKTIHTGTMEMRAFF